MTSAHIDTNAETTTAADEPVKVNSCVGTAMRLNEPPTAEITDAVHNRRNAATCNGRRSTTYAPRFTASPPRSPADTPGTARYLRYTLDKSSNINPALRPTDCLQDTT